MQTPARLNGSAIMKQDGKLHRVKRGAASGHQCIPTMQHRRHGADVGIMIRITPNDWRTELESRDEIRRQSEIQSMHLREQ